MGQPLDAPSNSMRKAAVLLAGLEPPLAEALLGQLPPAERARLRQESAGVGPIDAEERSRAMADFVRQRNSFRQPARGGVELDPELARRLDRPAAGAAVADAAVAGVAAAVAAGGPAAERPFRFLSDADPGALVPFLAKERPQTIAVVLSYLPAEQAALVLARLPAALQVDVIQRLARLDETDRESLRVVESELLAWMDQEARQRRQHAGGMRAVTGILAAAPATEHDEILANLRQHDRQLAQRIAAGGPDAARPRSAALPDLKFDDLAGLDPDSLTRLVRTCEPELVVLALTGASSQMLDRWIENLPRPDADSILRQLNDPGPIRLRDVETAQDELVALARHLQQQGAAGRPEDRLVAAA